ncbi:MAG: hypothetical protein J0I77_22875 [Rudaea sp.]|uniref:hypothetical protein n=1 Tax=unclassified Rudaea TaxID=2627037 RepID=UPI0010F79333|nr:MULTISPECIES: hypothetical protein [unclassified Rudaea]MBN8888575.1 hypothetical protein [Rudaea sp.]
MQSKVEELMKLGPLPGSANPDVVWLEKVQNLLTEIKQPVSDVEAMVLVKLFGPDYCFGLAWTLLHLIETAPGWPLNDVLDRVGGEWGDRLRQRARMGSGSSI